MSPADRAISRALVIIAGTGDDIINTWNKRRKS